MGDALSIAASVSGLITISAQIVGMAKELVDKVKDAPETMMRVREEVESMQPIFYQVQLLLNGDGSRLNHGNLIMISVRELMSTLTGCVIVYTWLERKVNEVCGFNDPTTASAAWKRAGVITDRVKWGLWEHKDIMVIITELQQQRLRLNLMLTIITCTSTTEASEVQARLMQLCRGILQSNDAQPVLNWDRQDEQAQVGSSAVSTRPSSAISHRLDNRGTSDNTSIMSQRSTFSFRLGRPAYIDDLKASRAYKRLRHFGRGIDSSAESTFSFDSDGTGSWSMLSDITLGDLSVSQIAVLNLPIELADTP
ncbi:hypothetical protein L211DRAFT_132337 [Terfezia boudieri ATCC MYA-4762]|uniref:Fungal N-terminal domain-containing protein n=1 Tax=Terfezia boudieri ATCC MYA-4762 TaxID=1051890 RepID=A0A3N4M3T7_9PEZI|nr:hypothetical protein L211DRAFT_132337 [Terfezia boudieri ATCC MYA-4762]